MPILAKQISKFSNQFTNTWIAITSNSNDILNTFDNERRIFKWNTVSHCLQNIIYTSWALYQFIKEKNINLKNGIVFEERLSTYHLELGYSFWLSWQEHLTEPQFFFHIPIIGNRNMRNLQMIIMLQFPLV